eukprot:Sro3521_g348870.1 n/a (194) ;mRNA; r:157-740
MTRANDDIELQEYLDIKATKERNVMRARMAHSVAKGKFESDVTFESLLPSKGNRNVFGASNVFPGLGTVKIKLMREGGIDTVKQLRDCVVADYSTRLRKILPGWKQKAHDYYTHYEEKLEEATLDLRTAEDEFEDIQETIRKHKEENPPPPPRAPAIPNPYARGRGRNNPNPPAEEEPVDESKPPPFSKFKDKK